MYFVMYGQLEGNILAPLIYRRTVHVNPLVTLVAILFLAEFMGIAGAVVAVPVAAAAQIVIAEITTSAGRPAGSHSASRSGLKPAHPPPAGRIDRHVPVVHGVHRDEHLVMAPCAPGRVRDEEPDHHRTAREKLVAERVTIPLDGEGRESVGACHVPEVAQASPVRP